jgi:hypothetical protein
MDIGQHFLEGSVVTLKAPFLVVETHRREGKEQAPAMTIEGYVKTKIIFKTRPKPVGLKRMLK